MTHLPAAPEAGLPMAPTEHDTAMSARPGSATSSAVLAFVQAGITAIATLSLLGFEAEGGALAASLLIKLAQFAGVGLLIFGGLQLMQGKSKTLLVAGSILELVLCLAYLVIFLLIPTFDLELVAGLKAVLVFVALLFAVMPTISIIQAQSGTTAAWLGSRRAH
jgi:hypothetical protein